MKKNFAILFVVFLFLFITPRLMYAHPNEQTLSGWWYGTQESWENGDFDKKNIYLHISKEGVSTFSYGTGGTWPTEVKINKGKVLIRIDRRMREFELKKNSSPILEAHYETTWSGWKTRRRIVMEKH